MSRDYQALLKALAPEIPEESRPGVTGPLEALEAVFRPLAKELKDETEPAYVLLLPTEWYQ